MSQSQSRPQDRHQALALAAVFQAGRLADQVATTGQCSSAEAEVLLASVLKMSPESYIDVYGSVESLAPGMNLLESALRGEQSRDNVRPVSYALALMHLSNRLRKDSALMSVLGNRLEALDAQRAHFTELAGSEFCHRLAGIYVDTLGTLSFRIKVQGEPAHLRNEDNAARIRALFLSGVRAAMLWHQAGGRRWQLLFSRRRLLTACEDLKKGRI